MKRALQINLGGQIFFIDEDAYERLRDYLTTIKEKNKKTEEGQEVLKDIEYRMAELFNDRLRGRREAISVDDVVFVLEKIGEPGDIFGGSEQSKSYYDRNRSYGYARTYRRMYRDSEHASLGGVCSGLAYYFDTDPVLLKVLFIVAFVFGFGFLLYIILWIVLPAARTPEEIQEMKGYI